MPFVKVGNENSGDINVHYEDYGQGKPVILIHGWPLSSASWEKQIPALVEAGYRVIAYDRRGFGKSSQPFSGYDADTLASDLHALILKLDLRDISLIGFSMGGGEVARYIGKYGSERISKAGFVSSVTPFLLNTPDNPEGVDKSIFDGLQKACRDDRPTFLAGFLPVVYHSGDLNGTRISEEVVRADLTVALGASPVATHDCIATWLTDYRDDLKRIDVPTLVVHGMADQNAPFAMTGKRMPDFVKHASMVAIEGAPHGLIWTHAEPFNRDLLSFLSSP